MSGLRIALLALVSNLRKDAEAHGNDVRHPRIVLENRASDAYRIVEMLDKAEAVPVASRDRIAEVLGQTMFGNQKSHASMLGVADALLAAGVFREEPAPPVSRGNFDARSTVFQS